MKFMVVTKERTTRGANYYKMLVEIANGIWEEAYYFGNTTPTEITSLHLSNNDTWVAEIQKHTSRDRDTGRFKGKRKVVKC